MLAAAATDSSNFPQEYAIGHKGLQGLYWPVQTVAKMSNDGNDAAEKWLGPHVSNQESRLSKWAMQTLPCMWIYGTKLQANYFPPSLNSYRTTKSCVQRVPGTMQIANNPALDMSSLMKAYEPPLAFVTSVSSWLERQRRRPLVRLFGISSSAVFSFV